MQIFPRIVSAVPRTTGMTAQNPFSKGSLPPAARRNGFRLTGIQTRSFYATRRQCLPPCPAPGLAAGYAALPSRRLISLSGPDAAKFLQGAITRNIYDMPPSDNAKEKLPRTRGFYGAFLSAQGRILNDVFVYPDTVGIGDTNAVGIPAGTSFLIEVDAREAGRLAKHIQLYKLRADFSVRLLEADEATVWQAWGGPAMAPAFQDEDGCLSTVDTRAPGMGVRFISIREKVPQSIAHELPLSHESAYMIRRYLHGVAEGQDELVREQALPLESNLDLMGGIDFRKGCYVGQELTIRTKHRGVVRKRILPVAVYGSHRGEPRWLEYTAEPELTCVPSDLFADHIPPGTEIGRYEKKGRSAGKFLRGIGNIGLALCRLETMTSVHVPGTEGASLFGGGFDPNDEFVMEFPSQMTAPNVVKVKAFVPEWLRKGLTVSVEEKDH